VLYQVTAGKHCEAKYALPVLREIPLQDFFQNPNLSVFPIRFEGTSSKNTANYSPDGFALQGNHH